MQQSKSVAYVLFYSKIDGQTIGTLQLIYNLYLYIIIYMQHLIEFKYFRRIIEIVIFKRP